MSGRLVAEPLKGPLFSEVGIDSLTKPGLFVPPAQSFFLQDLEDARFHLDAILRWST